MENLMPTLNNLNNETKKKVSMLKIDESCCFHSFPRGVFRTLLSNYVGNLLAKMINNYTTRSVKIQFLILILTNPYWDAQGVKC